MFGKVSELYSQQLVSHNRVQLAYGKCQFKLGNIKKAHTLISSAHKLLATGESEALIKEIEKMIYFESLIDWSMSNPLYSDAVALQQNAELASQQSSQQQLQHNNNSNGNNNALVSVNNSNASLPSPLRTMPILCPKVTSDYKYEQSKVRLCPPV